MTKLKKPVLYPEPKNDLYKKEGGKVVYKPDYEIIKDDKGNVIDIKSKDGDKR